MTFLSCAQVTCKKQWYDTGAGTVPTECSSGNEFYGGLCYTKCHSINGTEYDNAGCCVCRPKVKPNCEALGMRRGVDLSCRKKFQWRHPRIGECESGFEIGLGLCYRFCPRGYHGVGPVCWSQVPEVKDTAGVVHKWANCGAAAAKNPFTCGLVIADQATSVIMAIINIVTLGVSIAANSQVKLLDGAADAAKYLKRLSDIATTNQVVGVVSSVVDCGLSIAGAIAEKDPVSALITCAVAAGTFAVSQFAAQDTADYAQTKVDTKMEASDIIDKDLADFRRQGAALEGRISDLGDADVSKAKRLQLETELSDVKLDSAKKLEIENSLKELDASDAQRYDLDTQVEENVAKLKELDGEKKKMDADLKELKLDVEAYGTKPADRIKELEDQIEALPTGASDADKLDLNERLSKAKDEYAKQVKRRYKLAWNAEVDTYKKNVAIEAGGEAGDKAVNRE